MNEAPPSNRTFRTFRTFVAARTPTRIFFPDYASCTFPIISFHFDDISNDRFHVSFLPPARRRSFNDESTDFSARRRPATRFVLSPLIIPPFISRITWFPLEATPTQFPIALVTSRTVAPTGFTTKSTFVSSIDRSSSSLNSSFLLCGREIRASY